MGVYKRSNFIVNPRFQLKFSAYVAILVFVSSIIYPFTIYDLMESFIGYMSERAPELSGQLKDKQTSLIFILSIWQLGFTTLVFIGCIFFSHKIAGPMYKLQKFLMSIRDGEARGTLFFRKGDYFHEVADDLNDTFEMIEENYKNDFVYISEVSAYLKNLSMVVPEDKKVVLEEISKRLTQIQDRFNDDQEDHE